MSRVSSVGLELGRRTFLNGAGALALLLGGGLVACGKSTPNGPVEIETTDTCDSCGMMISDLRYAAEIIGRDRVWKFDDIGEMFAFPRKQRLSQNQIKAMYVHDFRSGSWLPAESAAYVVVSELGSPMGSGTTAFKDTKAARRFAQSQSGAVRSFAQLLADPPAFPRLDERTSP
jgi:nitrous oxide reductase accessory protein NosL